jgi:cell wall assembly regulator SMI1
MSNVVPFGGYTRLDINPEGVLEGAKGKLGSVLVLGYDGDGKLYAASSTADLGSLILLMEKFKHKVVVGDYDCE